MLGQGSKSKEKVAHNAAPPPELLFKQYGERVRHRGPAERVIVDISSVAPQQRLMRQEPVFPLIHGNTEPVACADRRLDLKQQRAPYSEQAPADTAHTASPILRNLIKLERGVVNDRLNGGDHTVVGVSDSHPAADRPHARLREAGSQLSNRVRMEDAIRIDRNDNLCRGVLQRIADRARLPAIDLIPPRPYAYVGEIALRLEHPLVAIVDRTVVLRDHFKVPVRIVALADALDRLVDRPAFVVARHQHAHGWLIRVVLPGLGAGKRKFHNDPHQIRDHGDQQAKNEDEPKQNGGHYRTSGRESIMPGAQMCRPDWASIWRPSSR